MVLGLGYTPRQSFLYFTLQSSALRLQNWVLNIVSKTVAEIRAPVTPRPASHPLPSTPLPQSRPVLGRLWQVPVDVRIRYHVH